MILFDNLPCAPGSISNASQEGVEGWSGLDGETIEWVCEVLSGPQLGLSATLSAFGMCLVFCAYIAKSTITNRLALHSWLCDTHNHAGPSSTAKTCAARTKLTKHGYDIDGGEGLFVGVCGVATPRNEMNESATQNGSVCADKLNSTVEA